MDGQAPEEEARQPLLNLGIASPAFVWLVTGVATYIPARRAASVEPTAALREW